MAIKNSRVRKIRRRTKALENFKSMSYGEYIRTHVLPNNDASKAEWAEYATKRRVERETLEKRISSQSRFA